MGRHRFSIPTRGCSTAGALPAFLLAVVSFFGIHFASLYGLLNVSHSELHFCRPSCLSNSTLRMYSRNRQDEQEGRAQGQQEKDVSVTVNALMYVCPLLFICSRSLTAMSPSGIVGTPPTGPAKRDVVRRRWRYSSRLPSLDVVSISICALIGTRVLGSCLIASPITHSSLCAWCHKSGSECVLVCTTKQCTKWFDPPSCVWRQLPKDTHTDVR